MSHRYALGTRVRRPGNARTETPEFVGTIAGYLGAGEQSWAVVRDANNYCILVWDGYLEEDHPTHASTHASNAPPAVMVGAAGVGEGYDR